MSFVPTPSPDRFTARWWRAHLATARLAARHLGGAASLRYWTERLRLHLGHGGRYALASRDARHPLVGRRGSSDLLVFEQIFVEREYACLDGLRDVGLVLDLGANVGYASAYVLSRWPSAHVVAVEPDPANVAVLRDNMAPYGARATVVEGAVWSHATRLDLAPPVEGEEWGRQVHDADAHDSDAHDSDAHDADGSGVAAFSVPDLIAMGEEALRRQGRAPASGRRVSLLKVDIEGAEVVVFGDGAPWLDDVEALVIEVHDGTSFGEGTPVVEAAVSGRGFAASTSGELSVYTRPR